MAKGQKEAMEELKPSLTAVIERWTEQVSETEAWEALNIYAGDNLSVLMSDAAIAVLGGIVDAHNYLRKERVIDA